MKKFLLLFVVALCLPVATWAYDFDDGTIQYTILEGANTVEVAGLTSSPTDVNVPETVEYEGTTYTVVGIGASAFASKTFTTITLPNTLEYIGDSAFNGAWMLTELTVPDSVTSLGSSWISNASSLGKLTIGKGITEIGDSEYQYCQFKELVLSGAITIGNNAFQYCTNLTSITLLSCVTMKSYAFRGCSALTSVTLSDSLETIETYAFNSCSALTEITLPANVSSIGNYTFGSCSKLASIYSLNPIPPTVLGDDQPYSGNNYPTLYIPAGTMAVYEAEWPHSGWVGYVLASEYVELDYAVFKIGADGYDTYYNADYDVTMPEGVTAYTLSELSDGYAIINEVADGVVPAGTPVILEGTTGTYLNVKVSEPSAEAVEVNLLSASKVNTTTYGPDEDEGYYFYDIYVGKNGAGLGWIDTSGSAFDIYANKAWLAVPQSETTNDTFLFKVYEEPTYCDFEVDGIYYMITSDDTVEVTFKYEDGDYPDEAAYPGCYTQESIEVPETVVFDGATYTVIGVGYEAFAYGTFYTVSLPNTIEYIDDYAFAMVENLSELTIPGSVTYFGEGILFWNESVEKLTIEEGVTEIGGFAFEELYITELVLPSTLETIGRYAFDYCTDLASVTMPSVVTLADHAFYGCSKLTTITLPDNLETIETGAFQYCGLTEVTLPVNVSSLGSSAFGNCTSLTVVNSLNPVPPTTPNDTDMPFNSCTKYPILYVPAGTVAVYDDTWNDFTKSYLNEDTPIVDLDYAVFRIEVSAGEDGGYDTYYNVDYDVTLPEGVEAYTAYKVSDSYVYVNKVDGPVPAATPVVLKGDLGTYLNVTVSEPTVLPIEGNLLSASEINTTTYASTEDDYYFYEFNTYRDTDPGFYFANNSGSAFDIPANKVWLAVLQSEEPATTLLLKFDDDVTEPEPEPEPDGIESVSAAEGTDAIYNLQGVRVSSMNQKGIYIVNGKKVVKK